MARPVNQVLWDQWRQRMERQRESGLSIAEFCRRENVSPATFHAWKRKLRHAASVRRGSGEAAGAQRSRNRRDVVTPRGGTRHAVAGRTVPTGFLELPVAAARPSPLIEVALADGTVVRLPQQNLAALVTVLRALRGESLEPSSGESGHA